MYRHNCRTSSRFLSSQLCIWPSVGNAFEALQEKLLCRLWRRLGPGEEARRLGADVHYRLAALALVLTPACAVRLFVSL